MNSSYILQAMVHQRPEAVVLAFDYTQMKASIIPWLLLKDSKKLIDQESTIRSMLAVLKRCRLFRPPQLRQTIEDHLKNQRAPVSVDRPTQSSQTLGQIYS